MRVTLDGGNWPTVIVKHISPPVGKAHPRGWNTDIGHQRKLRSYQVEEAWYRHHAKPSNQWRTARFIAAVSSSNGQLIVMEDLDVAGYDLRKHRTTLSEIKACLSWLAHFHASFLGKEPSGLWEEGTYWHLATRPEELKVMRDGVLKEKAYTIDKALRNCRFRTFVHGDAKLANFCFARDGRVAAVDFQYVGGGCGMKDLAYLIGGCLPPEDCFALEAHVLNTYFAALREALSERGNKVETDALEADWRRLYPYAWADFERFLMGWSPGHWKMNAYSEHMTEQALAACGG